MISTSFSQVVLINHDYQFCFFIQAHETLIVKRVSNLFLPALVVVESWAIENSQALVLDLGRYAGLRIFFMPDLQRALFFVAVHKAGLQSYFTYLK